MRGIRRGILLALAVVGSPAMAEELPKPGKLDERVRFVAYEPHQVVRVAGWLRHSIQIEFSPEEEILQVALGNSVAWEVAPVGHILFLKPREHQPSTNMSVVTQRRDGSKRSYQIELATINGPMQQKLQPFFLVKYQYPADEAERRRVEGAARAQAHKAGDAERALTASELNGPRNWSYSVEGETSFEPTEVYDNGKVTTFTFKQNVTIPAISIVNGDGTESLVPKTTRLLDVIVHAVSEKFVLRDGDDVLCVHNEGFVAGGIATGTLTTSPRVDRVTKPVISKGATGAGVGSVSISPLSPPTSVAPADRRAQGK